MAESNDLNFQSMSVNERMNLNGNYGYGTSMQSANVNVNGHMTQGNQGHRGDHRGFSQVNQGNQMNQMNQVNQNVMNLDLNLNQNQVPSSNTPILSQINLLRDRMSTKHQKLSEQLQNVLNTNNDSSSSRVNSIKSNHPKVMQNMQSKQANCMMENYESSSFSGQAGPGLGPASNYYNEGVQLYDNSLPAHQSLNQTQTTFQIPNYTNQNLAYHNLVQAQINGYVAPNCNSQITPISNTNVPQLPSHNSSIAQSVSTDRNSGYSHVTVTDNVPKINLINQSQLNSHKIIQSRYSQKENNGGLNK